MRLAKRMALGARRAWPLALALGAVLVAGCFDEPEIEDRWSRVDILSSTITPGQTVPPGSLDSVQVRVTVTYRSILTGFAVAELRASPTIAPTMVVIHPDAPRVPMATAIDSLLANSVTLGRGTRAVTGWDHLIQTIDFTFNGSIPPSPVGLFLVCYLADGEEIELGNGSDSLVVTPFPSAQYEVLPVGMELAGTP
jgi:hypothetical protein